MAEYIKYTECRKCIYKPCGKCGDDVTYCLIRFLIWEAEDEAKRRKKNV